MFAIRALGYVREDLVCDFEGQYLEWYDPDVPDPNENMATFTGDITKAKRFPSVLAAVDEWNRVRTCDPIRPDGRPNKPLTALTITVEPVPEAS